MKTVIYLDELLLTNFLALQQRCFWAQGCCARAQLQRRCGCWRAVRQRQLASLGILLPELPGPASVPL